jgi:hypothetical protein
MSDTDEALKAHMLAIGARARAGAMSLRHAPAAQRTSGLLAMAEQMRLASPDILRANALDVSAAEQVGQAASLIDRLRLDGHASRPSPRGSRPSPPRKIPSARSKRAGASPMAWNSPASARLWA